MRFWQRLKLREQGSENVRSAKMSLLNQYRNGPDLFRHIQSPLSQQMIQDLGHPLENELVLNHLSGVAAVSVLAPMSTEEAVKATVGVEVAAIAEARAQPKAHSVRSSTGAPSHEIVAPLSLATTKDAIEMTSLSLRGLWRTSIARHLGPRGGTRRALEDPIDLHRAEAIDRDHHTKVMVSDLKSRIEDKVELRVSEILGGITAEISVSEISRPPTIVRESEA